jgi:UDP-N-acetylglucosamine--dolichyl-phosphate N-acetylglucosaminephosphotransferase
LASVIYLFLLYRFGNIQSSSAIGGSPELTLAVCILFGGFMGLIDDWVDLRWRYKAFLPIVASLPIAVLRQATPVMSTYFWGKIDFRVIHFFGIPGDYIFYFGVIPLIVTITTNTVNQLGGLNGLETLCPSIILFGLLLAASPEFQVMLYAPLLVYLILAYFNVRGKIFVGNTGSFAIGITLASFALAANIEQTLVISILPYVLNSSLILLNVFFSGSKANVSFDGEKLSSDHRRSLVTLVTYKRRLSERQVVATIALLMAVSTCAALLVEWFTL